MAKTVRRTISDREVSLIKAMLRRGMANNKIQFFFNRPDRQVNSGRISTIKNGTYSNSSEIDAASDVDLDEFLKEFVDTEVSASVSIPAVDSAPPSGPVDTRILQRMFFEGEDGVWRFRYGESDTHECKESFGLKYAHKWMKAVAAMSNNLGGYILFGVKDKSKNEAESLRVVGLNSPDFEDTDPADISKRLKAAFDPTPRFDQAIIQVGAVKVGILYVHQHQSRPVISTGSSEGQIKEGDILFRYSGQSARIKYSDLRSILDERDQQAREQILPMVQRLLELGPRDAMVADLTDGTINGVQGSIVIDEKLLERIKFIREGEFDEKDGSPALRLVGDVQAVDSEGKITKRGFVTNSDIVYDFVHQVTPSDPSEYIRCAVEAGSGAWLPIHFFADSAKMDRNSLVKFIGELKASPKYKETFTARASMKSSAYSERKGGLPADYLDQILAGVLPSPSNVREAASLGNAFAGLPRKPPIQLPDMLLALDGCRQLLESSEKRSWMSSVRRGLARLDELFFACVE